MIFVCCFAVRGCRLRSVQTVHRGNIKLAVFLCGLIENACNEGRTRSRLERVSDPSYPDPHASGWICGSHHTKFKFYQKMPSDPCHQAPRIHGSIRRISRLGRFLSSGEMYRNAQLQWELRHFSSGMLTRVMLMHFTEVLINLSPDSASLQLTPSESVRS